MGLGGSPTKKKLGPRSVEADLCGLRLRLRLR